MGAIAQETCTQLHSKYSRVNSAYEWNGRAVEPAGPDTSDAVTDAESTKAVSRNESVTTAPVAVAVSAVVCEAVVAESVSESALIVAVEGTTDITPKPNAATVTSAMRLKVVFVDICFLSIVDLRTIRRSARSELVTPSRYIARADVSNSPPCIRTRRRNLFR